MANFGYLNGTSRENQDKAPRYVGPGSVAQSQNPYRLVTTGDGPETYVLGIDTPLGGNPLPVHNDLRTLRNPNSPSGYDVQGVPTYGDGKRNTTTDAGEDRSHGVNQEFTYLTPTRVTSKAFEDL